MLVAMLLARSDEVAEMRRRDILKAALGFTWIAVPNATVAQTHARRRLPAPPRKRGQPGTSSGGPNRRPS